MPKRDKWAGVEPEKLKGIIDAIEDNGPRDHNNELLPPYLDWVRKMKADLIRYEQWVFATEGKKGDVLPDDKGSGQE